MKSMFCLAVLLLLVSMVYASGHKGISVKIPLPLIKIRFIDIAQLFGHGGHEGGHGGIGFGVDVHGGHGHHGW